jgi:hypothetical protein
VYYKKKKSPKLYRSRKPVPEKPQNVIICIVVLSQWYLKHHLFCAFVYTLSPKERKKGSVRYGNMMMMGNGAVFLSVFVGTWSAIMPKP